MDRDLLRRAPEAQQYHRASDRTCVKVQHGSRGGHLHAADDDAVFDVDGVPYCGRCHHAIDAAGFCSVRPVAEAQQPKRTEAPYHPDFVKSFDAQEWATAFRSTALSLGYSDMDEGWLIGWFANAIMRGFDEHVRRSEAEEQQPEVDLRCVNCGRMGQWIKTQQDGKAFCVDHQSCEVAAAHARGVKAGLRQAWNILQDMKDAGRAADAIIRAIDDVHVTQGVGW